MGWPLAILLTAAGAFILLNLLRSKEEARRRRPVQGSAREQDDNPERKRQAPVTDLDRFLQEVHRRRRQAEGEEATPQPRVEPVIVVRPPARPDRVGPIPGRRPARSRERQPARRSDAAAFEAIPVAIAVEEPRSAARSGPEPSATVFPASPPALPAVRAVQSVEASRSGARRGKSFFALLNSRQALRDAIVLREILGPPLCKRDRTFR
jgi:hypothetical protein